jgi:ribonuclease Z
VKPSFHARLLNGPFDDPGLYVRLLREARALLFDTGYTVNLSARDILKISDIFVSHTHVDHFIGFDSILRICLKKEAPLRLYGPRGFITHMEGKLRSYTWNLINNYSLNIEVTEVQDERVVKALFRSANFFKRENLEERYFDGILLEEDFFTVNTAVFDHQIPCLGFSLKEDYHINIDKAKLKLLNLPVGPWLAELKNVIRNNLSGHVFNIHGQDFALEQLRDIATKTKGQKISYLVDMYGNEENIQKAIELVKDSDVLYIETYFLHRDRDMAEKRYHLTARQAGRIAREAGARNLEVFHFSPRYREVPGTLAREADEEYRK